ncbi:hypothetical protein WJX77_002847 [Trebouxia sp. C0004]
MCIHLAERTQGDAHTAPVGERLGRPGPLGWCRDKKAPFMLKRWLRRLQAQHVVTQLAVSDIQECFTIPQDVKLAEASASQAVAQLLAEEQQAAAKAAAKKAKKLRQKQAKQQLLQPEPAHLQDAQPADSPQTTADSASSIGKPATPVQQTPPDKVGAARNGMSDADFLRSLFCCPISHSMVVDPVVAADERTYERSAMEAWLQQHHVSPVRGHHLVHADWSPM